MRPLATSGAHEPPTVDDMSGSIESSCGNRGKHRRDRRRRRAERRQAALRGCSVQAKAAVLGYGARVVVNDADLIALLRDPACPSSHLFRAKAARTVYARDLLELARSRLDPAIVEQDVAAAVQRLGGRRTTEVSLDNLTRRVLERLRGRPKQPARVLYEIPAHLFRGLDPPVQVPRT